MRISTSVSGIQIIQDYDCYGHSYCGRFLHPLKGMCPVRKLPLEIFCGSEDLHNNTSVENIGFLLEISYVNIVVKNG